MLNASGYNRGTGLGCGEAVPSKSKSASVLKSAKGRWKGEADFTLPEAQGKVQLYCTR